MTAQMSPSARGQQCADAVEMLQFKRTEQVLSTLHVGGLEIIAHLNLLFKLRKLLILRQVTV